MAADGLDGDFYQRFEREVRTPKRRLPLDAFLPPADAIPSAVAPPAPPPAVEVGGDEAETLKPRASGEPRAMPKPRAIRKRTGSKGTAQPKTLQEEIEEFMNRDQRGISPDDDFTPFTSQGIDPNLDPDPSADR